MGGVVVSASSCGATVLVPLGRGCSVAVFGPSGVDLAALAGEVSGLAPAWGFERSGVLRVRLDGGPSTEGRIEAFDALLDGVVPRSLLVVDEPDADLAFLDAVPIVDHILQRATDLSAPILFTTKTVGQAAAAERCFRLAKGRLRAIL